MALPFCSDAELQKHLEDGWTKSKIAEHYNVRVPTVRRRIYELGALKTGRMAEHAERMVDETINAALGMRVNYEIGMDNLFRLSERAEEQADREESIMQAIRTVNELHADDDLFDPHMLQLLRDFQHARDPIPDSIKQQAELRAQMQLFMEMQKSLYDMESLAALHEMVRQLLLIPDERVRTIIKRTLSQAGSGRAMLGIDAVAPNAKLPAELPPIIIDNPERKQTDAT